VETAAAWLQWIYFMKGLTMACAKKCGCTKKTAKKKTAKKTAKKK
jgi:hypothetical protein